MAKNTGPKKTWSYSNKFKIKAVKLSYLPGIQSGKVAEGLGIHPYMLSRWRKEYREGLLQGDGKKRVGMMNKKSSVSTKQLTENAQLKKEIELLKKENDLLKKWQRFLAERHQSDLDSSKSTKMR